jgi:transposase
MTVTGLVAYAGDGSQYKNGRQFAASLGLVPRHVGSGGENTNLGITKHGDRYLRKLLVHGGRAVTAVAQRKPELGEAKAVRLLSRGKPSPKVAVAIANRNARIAWRIIAKGETYDPRRA